MADGGGSSRRIAICERPPPTDCRRRNERGAMKERRLSLALYLGLAVLGGWGISGGTVQD
jgi:hypothetical protein